MPGYEPKGRIEPQGLPHTCEHGMTPDHACHCSIGVDHTLSEWLDRHPGSPDTKGE